MKKLVKKKLSQSKKTKKVVRPIPQKTKNAIASIVRAEVRKQIAKAIDFYELTPEETIVSIDNIASGIVELPPTEPFAARPMITKIEGQCSHKDCDQLATHIACGRDSNYEIELPACYCEKHAIEVAGNRFPEYIVDCPNCKCQFGVN